MFESGHDFCSAADIPTAQIPCLSTQSPSLHARRDGTPDPASDRLLSDGSIVADLHGAARPGSEPAVRQTQKAWSEIGLLRYRNQTPYPPPCCAPSSAARELCSQRRADVDTA